ncbi:MAG: orotidine-5'-phosphate decarboxylase [Rhodobacteraceae bacterium]|nr:orotidine-5'-phosphate decarboxylase [Paracoccaceae bacterium]
MFDDRLIVALDVADAETALALVRRLGDRVSFYKIGLGLLAQGGLDLAQDLKHEHGKRVFLDLKLFDIGSTIARTVRGLQRYGADFLTVHGDPHVVRAARQGAGPGGTRILAVTVLTSLNRGDLKEALIGGGALDNVAQERARRAFAAGADGVIASPHEAAQIRALPDAQGRAIVAPGVRPLGVAAGDQKRVATPGRAILAGADHIVVGRPVYQASDPCRAVEEILAQLPPSQGGDLRKGLPEQAIGAGSVNRIDVLDRNMKEAAAPSL